MGSSPGDATFPAIRPGPGRWTEAEIRLMPKEGFQKTLGIYLLEVRPELVVAELALRPELMNSSGRLHGGALMGLADSLGAIGAVQHLAPDQFTATMESKSNFFGTVQGDKARAHCRPLHLGRSTSVWMTEIRGDTDRLAAVVVQTQLHFTRG